MEFEFDNEIDAILRQARNGDFASAANPKSDHLDADEISAFAENALPEKTKRFYTEHLADCGRCRQTLSNIIFLNSEAELETAASSAVSVPENVVGTSVPWYRKLFIFPQLTYIMGALVLTFGGFLAYLVVQNSGKSAETSSVSSVRERPQNMSGASSDGDTTIIESSRANSNAAIMQSNTSSNSAANVSNASMMSNSGAMSSNASAANSSAAPRREPTGRQKEESVAPLPTPAENKNQSAVGSAMPPPSAMQAQPSVTAQDKPEEVQEGDDKAKIAETSRERKADAESSVSDSATAERRTSKNAPAPKSVAKSAVSGETKRTGGRNFTRKNGVWYDANYNGQNTINVSRNTDDYRKLDSGLRSIADNLGGTVVVVWKDKAYRIQ